MKLNNDTGCVVGFTCDMILKNLECCNVDVCELFVINKYAVENMVNLCTLLMKWFFFGCTNHWLSVHLKNIDIASHNSMSDKILENKSQLHEMN